MNDRPDALQVATPERVAVDLQVAGLGSRVMAYLVDLALVGAVALVAYFVITTFIPDPVNALLDLSTVARTALGSFLLFGLWVYWTVFEVAWNGQSPGKRLVHVRVVHHDGTPITAFSAAIRNLLRIVDFLPICYPVGVISALIDRRHRRLGDLLAGTVLVRDEPVNLDAYERLSASPAVALDLLELCVQFLQRSGELEAPHRGRIARALAARLELGLPATATDDEVVAALRARLEQR